MKHKSLLQINTTLNYGSTGRIAENISILAEKNGFDCYIAHGGRYINKSSIKSIRVSSKIDNYIHAFVGEFLRLHGLGSFISTCNFIRKIKRIQPDIIHLHNIHGYYINYPLLFKFLAKYDRPVVWTLHDCWTLTGHCTHFENYGCEKWKTECYDCPLLMAQYKSRVFDFSRYNYRLKKKYFNQVKNLTVVPVSKWLEGKVMSSHLKKNDTQVIRNGIDLNVFSIRQTDLKRSLGLSDRPIILGVASGWGKEKGIGEFIQLSQRGKYHVIIVGVSQKLKKDLPQELIAIERTHSQAELADYYNIADVFVNPTYNDTLPTVNMEALACGTPVVTYNTGGSPELIDDTTGVVVPRGDTSALEQAIDKVIEKGKGIYSFNCRKRAEENYNKEERFTDYIDLYKKLITK